VEAKTGIECCKCKYLFSDVLSDHWYYVCSHDKWNRVFPEGRMINPNDGGQNLKPTPKWCPLMKGN
jgi:hypothetical protein